MNNYDEYLYSQTTQGREEYEEEMEEYWAKIDRDIDRLIDEEKIDN